MATEAEKKQVLEELEKLSGSNQEEGVEGRRALMTTLFPVQYTIWQEAFRMACNNSTPVKELATTVSQDPVLVLELLRISNAVFFASSTSVLNAQTAIVRLGSDMTQKTLEKINQRPTYKPKEVQDWFEHFRSKCKKTSIAARIVAEAVQRSLADDCQTAGLFMSVGNMLAVSYLKEKYVKLTKDNSPARVDYLLANNHKFDTERMGVQYLRAIGIPEDLVAAVDRKAQIRSQDRAMMRPIVFAAAELVEAFESNKWEKVAPGKNLPPKSNLRLLRLPEIQYSRVYDRVEELLRAFQLAEAKDEDPTAQEKQNVATETSESIASETEQTNGPTPTLTSTPAPDLTETQPTKRAETSVKVSRPTSTSTQRPKVDRAPSPASGRSYEEIDPEDQFNLNGSNNKDVARASTHEVDFIPPPVLRTKKGNAMVASINSEIENLDNSEDMIEAIMDLLVSNGPFQKSALIVTSRDRTHAIVVAARGPNIGNGQRLDLDDPLSPLAQCFSKVRSFSNTSSKESPFGSRAFALAPVDACHDTPVALYADCGNEQSISFEARRVFRVAIDLLNQKLPTVPGGIPVEL